MENEERLREMIFSNGDMYVGNLRGMIAHGKGKYKWSDGTVYDGDWEEGRMTGKGKIFWPTSQTTYDGDFSAGYLNGFGTYIGSDGSIYKGSWKMSSQHGIGRKQYPNSDVYDGCWRQGVREGCGRYGWSNGNMYIGNWKNGKMCGRGVMKWFNGDLFDGFWSNGLRHGSGFYRSADGSYYFGTWSKGLKDGPGTFYPAGNKHLSKLVHGEHMDKRKKQISHIPSQDSEESVILSVNRSLPDKISSFRRGTRTFSQKTSSLDDDAGGSDSMRVMLSRERACIISNSSCDGQSEIPDYRCVAYEREYMQGVLIKEKVKNISRLSHRSKQRLKFAKEVKRRSCLNIFKGHKSYYLMLSLQLGIRYTVGKITPVPMRDVRSSDFVEHARIKMYFPTKGSQLTPPHNSIDFYWKDYCPMVFRNLRELFRLNAADYMMSICGDNGLRELSSPGKSGSIFYLSHDDRFVIKTLKKRELKVFRKMLPHYYGHVQAHDNTLITKFFGAHRITLRHGKKVRFVVMGNMFCTELHIHRRYDLKGSSQGRFTNKDEIDESTTLKDLDLTYEFHMDRLLNESLFRLGVQLSLDSAFLESQRIIDYSLLLGLHFRAPEHLGVISQGELSIPPKGLVLVTHEPGCVSTTPGSHIRGSTLKAYSIGNKEADLLLPGTGRLRVQLGVNMPAQANQKITQAETDSAEVELFEVYDVVLYLGIIDILQEYNMKKKIEHTCKSFKYDPLSISAVEPKIYSKRFITFLKKIFPHQSSNMT
ncbi:hypothetical protein OROMI_033411 [Orobanche minor]